MSDGNATYRVFKATAIGAVLLALGAALTWGVQCVRLADQRTASKDHLHDLGVAFRNVDEAYNSLPDGPDAKDPKHGWHTRILSFME